MRYILIPVIVWFLSQTAKLIVSAVRKKRLSWGLIVWTYSWSGGAPSTHSATLSSITFLLGQYIGFDNPIFAFAVIVSMIFMYNLMEDKEQHELREERLKEVFARFKIKAKKNFKLFDIHGHTSFEIGTGIVFGLFLTWILEFFVK